MQIATCMGVIQEHVPGGYDTYFSFRSETENSAISWYRNDSRCIASPMDETNMGFLRYSVQFYLPISGIVFIALLTIFPFPFFFPLCCWSHDAPVLLSSTDSTASLLVLQPILLKPFFTLHQIVRLQIQKHEIINSKIQYSVCSVYKTVETYLIHRLLL